MHDFVHEDFPTRQRRTEEKRIREDTFHLPPYLPPPSYEVRPIPSSRWTPSLTSLNSSPNWYA